jgi:hypothetical protein
MTIDTQNPQIKEVVRLMESSGLMCGFVVQAIREFAKQVVEADPEEVKKNTKGFVDGDAWISCAKEIVADTKL